jgi:hypothetical protein
MLSDEQRAVFEPHLTAALHYAPPWLDNLTVRYDPDESNLLSTSVLPEYRTSSIRVGNGWFSETEHERAVSVYHEVLHAHVETLAVVFHDLLTAWEPDEAMQRWAKEQWRRAEEATVCDLSRSITNREKRT